MRKSIFVLFAFLSFLPGTFAQTQSPEDKKKQDKELAEYIQKEVDRMTDLLDLDIAQEFYIDSIYTHDYNAMRAEIEDLQHRKISNTDLYVDVQNKWGDQIYESVHKVLREDQWAKYLKSGAAKAKKQRDKARAKKAGKK